MTMNDSIKIVNTFKSGDLTKRLSDLEMLKGQNSDSIKKLCQSEKVDDLLLESAKKIKKISAEIDVVIHSVGILRSLENILYDDEIIDYVSLGAGNTGKKFDLETSHRVAEYKFIDWQGGSESIRQNGIFKDFYSLAEDTTQKEKFLYLNGTDIPLRFFNGGRALTSVLSRRPLILDDIKKKYGSSIERVRDYYEIHEHAVQIRDVREYIK